MTLSTGPLAASSARHPWPVVGEWVAVALLAIIAIAMFLSLTTEGAPTNDPESKRADEVRLAAFPPGPATARDRCRVIRSDVYEVDSAQFEAFVRDFVDDAEITALGRARTYLEDSNGGLVSDDRHATMIPVALLDDDETEALVEKVEALADDAFAVSVTGQRDARPRLRPALARGPGERGAQVRAPRRR